MYEKKSKEKVDLSFVIFHTLDSIMQKLVEIGYKHGSEIETATNGIWCLLVTENDKIMQKEWDNLENLKTSDELKKNEIGEKRFLNKLSLIRKLMQKHNMWRKSYMVDSIGEINEN